MVGDKFKVGAEDNILPQQILPRNGEEKMPKGVAAIIFFFAWLICGCGVETMLDSPASGAVTLVALIVVIVCANVITRNDDK